MTIRQMVIKALVWKNPPEPNFFAIHTIIEAAVLGILFECPLLLTRAMALETINRGYWGAVKNKLARRRFKAVSPRISKMIESWLVENKFLIPVKPSELCPGKFGEDFEHLYLNNICSENLPAEYRQRLAIRPGLRGGRGFQISPESISTTLKKQDVEDQGKSSENPRKSMRNAEKQGPRNLAYFERRLSKAGNLEEKFRTIFEGLILNMFTLGRGKIDRENLATLEIRYSDAYQTVKDSETRRTLVLIKMFDVSTFKNPASIFRNREMSRDSEPSMRIEDPVELAISSWENRSYEKFFRALDLIAARSFSEHIELVDNEPTSFRDPKNVYGGSDAIKVLLKATFLLGQLLLKRTNNSTEIDASGENYNRLRTWLKLDKAKYVTHVRQIELGLRNLGFIFAELNRHI